MQMKLEEADPKGLVRESYAIEGITEGECRSIFVDWALSMPLERSTSEALEMLLTTYAAVHAGHPMNPVLEAARAAPDTPRRRGGRMGRVGE